MLRVCFGEIVSKYLLHLGLGLELKKDLETVLASHLDIDDSFGFS